MRTFIYDVLLWHGRRREIMWEAGGFSSYGYCLGSHILWPCKAHMDICSPLMTSGIYENKQESLLQLPTVFPHQSPLLGNPFPIHLCVAEKEVRLSRKRVEEQSRLERWRIAARMRSRKERSMYQRQMTQNNGTQGTCTELKL